MKSFEKSTGASIPAMRREGVVLSSDALVRISCFESVPLPLIVEAQLDGLNLQGWAKANRSFIETSLLKHGAVLFRRFRIQTRRDFEDFVSSVSTKLLEYIEGATPRTHLGGRIYTSTEFSASQRIMPHNELSYVKTWPTRIWFCCLTPSETGGETPLVDIRRVFQRIEPSIRETFQQKGWMLVRNFVSGMGPSWQNAFHTEDKASVETYCRSADIECEWIDEDRLRTRQVRPAVARHLTTGEWLWFNHIAFWHVSSLPVGLRESMVGIFTEAGVPYSVFYGDGSPIDGTVIEAITDAYSKETYAFTWMHGDVLMIDNMLVAHGRNSYTGSREVVVAMGDPCSDRGLTTVG